MVHRYREACRDPRRALARLGHQRPRPAAVRVRHLHQLRLLLALRPPRGLRSLGLVMALGTACIYLATLCVLRPLLLWQLATRGGDDAER